MRSTQSIPCIHSSVYPCGKSIWAQYFITNQTRHSKPSDSEVDKATKIVPQWQQKSQPPAYRSYNQQCFDSLWPDEDWENQGRIRWFFHSCIHQTSYCYCKRRCWWLTRIGNWNSVKHHTSQTTANQSSSLDSEASQKMCVFQVWYHRIRWFWLLTIHSQLSSNWSRKSPCI